MPHRLLSLVVIIWATLTYTNTSMLNSQPRFILKAEKNKAFNGSYLFATFNIKSGNIADCLEHCLEHCRCQSFQICHETKCQLCSSHKEENSSLLRDEDGCVYATYELREKFENFDGQCSDMSCSMKYNCCQQSGLCPKNKICKPYNSLAKPWKRFTCECPDGYYGEHCKKPITSCRGHVDTPQKSGMYKVADSDGSEYEVYCHFDSDAASWTLVQSYSFSNGSHTSKFPKLRKPLSEDHAVSENDLTWSGYRLSKPRMKSIKNDSAFLQFTCDYEKNLAINKSDYVQIRLRNIKIWQRDENIDPLELAGGTSYVTVGDGCGKIGGYDLNRCEFQLHQYVDRVLHVVKKYSSRGPCKLNVLNCSWQHEYFGSYHVITECFKELHRCVQNANSTTQLWFGTRSP